jgi:precorrin isomerase
MKLLLALLVAVTLAACGSSGKILTSQVPITKAEAQKILADAQIVHAAVVRVQIAYLDQKPCGLAGSPAPPLCASLKISRQMTAYDKAFTETMRAAQNDVEVLGDNPSVLSAATKAVRFSLDAYKTFTEANTKGKAP